MHGLERSSNDAEQRLASDVKQTQDVRPPREIGENTKTKAEAPREIGISETHTAPRELTESDKPQETILGGSYRDCKKVSDGNTKEVHHVPAKEASYLSEADGPCIIMEKADHRMTASCGASKEAREYRAKQKELIDHGKFREAFEMDKQDIQSKCGDKYDKAIAQAEAYLSKLEQGGFVK